MLLFTFSDQGLKYYDFSESKNKQVPANCLKRGPFWPFTLDEMCLGFWKLSQFSDPIAERMKQQNGDSRWKNEKTQRLYFCYCVMKIISNEENYKNQLISQSDDCNSEAKKKILDSTKTAWRDSEKKT